jgi:putative NADH-flavin reductase
MTKVALSGAGGIVGSILRKGLRERGFDLRAATRQQCRRITRAIVSMGDAVGATQSQLLLSSLLS